MHIEVIHGENFSSNSFILIEETKKKLLIIDLGLSGELTKYALRKKLREICGDNTRIQVEVFLTHCHVDHILGSDNLSDFNNILYSSSPLTAKHINNNDGISLISQFGLQDEINFQIKKEYKDTEIIPFAGAKMEVIHSPGHTDGSAVIYDHITKSLFAGDVVFDGGACGRTDLPTGDRKKLIITLSKLADLDIEHLYSGHGPDLHKNVRENILSAKKMLEMW
ncbi:MAG TPA: MBL fold metallo-hydrolase [candidate division Zixibacteria bacterium]|nr:MBL fold metallo-hydrolase [candidate division Zixibacteria bacterium]